MPIYVVFLRILFCPITEQERWFIYLLKQFTTAQIMRCTSVRQNTLIINYYHLYVFRIFPRFLINRLFSLFLVFFITALLSMCHLLSYLIWHYSYYTSFRDFPSMEFQPQAERYNKHRSQPLATDSQWMKWNSSLIQRYSLSTTVQSASNATFPYMTTNKRLNAGGDMKTQT